MDTAALHLLAQSSIRRLWLLRHDARHGQDARTAIRQWLRTLRAPAEVA